MYIICIHKVMKTGQETHMSLWAPYLAHDEYQISKSRGAQCMSEDNKECDIMNKK